jgi:hypothetical protein
MIGFPALTESATILVVSIECMSYCPMILGLIEELPQIPDAAEQNVTAWEPPNHGVSLHTSSQKHV